MTQQNNSRTISLGEWEVAYNRVIGKPIGMYLTGSGCAGVELQGIDFLYIEEVLELRDFINEHFGNKTTQLQKWNKENE